MAEALGIVGAAASFIQLIDASLRTSLSLYAFFSALNNALPELQRHIILIRDIHDVVQLVRKTADAAAFEEAEKIMLTRQLKSIVDELSTLQKVTDGKDPAKFGTKMRWIMKKPETRQTLQNLENHKTCLILQLQALNIGQSRQILNLQSSSSTDLGSLKLLLEQQKQDVTMSNSNIQASLAGLHTMMESNLQLHQESLDASRNQNMMASESHLDEAIRRVLNNHILPEVEKRFAARSEMNNTVILPQVQAVMKHATAQILSQVDKNTSGGISTCKRESSINKHSRPREPRSPNPSSRCLQPDSSLSTFGPTNITTSLTNSTPGSSTWRGVLISKWSHCIPIPHIGIFRIDYRVYARPRDRFLAITIDFWPTNNRIPTRGISLRYSSSRDSHGYTALFPSLAIRRIISIDDRIAKLIMADDTDGVQVLFQTHQNSPFDRYQGGMTLLEHALVKSSYRTAQFLLSQGADPTEKDIECGWNSLRDLVELAVQGVALGQWSIRGEDLSIFCNLFHSIVAAGCDPDDSDLSPFSWYIISEDSGALQFHQDEGDDVAEYLAGVRSLAQFLEFQGIKVITSWSVFEAFRDPSEITLLALQALGLKTDYQGHSFPSGNSVIYMALRAFDDPLGPLDALMNNLVSLILNGANIYDIQWGSGSGWYEEDGIVSPTLFAEGLGLMKLWMEALEAAGYDPEEVVLEDIRRCQEFRRLHGARSSGVEVSQTDSECSIRRRLV
ncbi:ankyrin repeat protein [Fusarium austroafricanum]|uniref:Ankyrin repeat protein n=1 Tax=Fusarium austroafricanum TaxID=2364996 RepID=A0A8H4NSP8_9HYPO|nr:ankyrin repeat protein [Fusarium austroafricanum]